MRTYLRATAALLAAVVILGISARAGAVPIVLYNATQLPSGLYKYNLFVNNDGGSEALSGLTVLNGNSVFGLDGDSTIGAPSGWSFFAPLPPLIDDLNYFSLAAASDILVDGTRGGFSFVSATDPDTIAGDDFQVEGIGADTATQIDLGIAQVPEPSTWLLVAAACAGLALRRRARLPRA